MDDDVRTKIKIVQQSLDNMEQHAANELNKYEYINIKVKKLIKEYTEELDKYKSKYPEYFV